MVISNTAAGGACRINNITGNGVVAALIYINSVVISGCICYNYSISLNYRIICINK